MAINILSKIDGEREGVDECDEDIEESVEVKLDEL